MTTDSGKTAKFVVNYTQSWKKILNNNKICVFIHGAPLVS